MKKYLLVLILFLSAPLEGGLKENAWQEIQSTKTFLLSVSQKVSASGSARATEVFARSRKMLIEAYSYYNKRRYMYAIQYAKESREAGGFAVKLAVGRQRSKEGILSCRRYINIITAHAGGLSNDDALKLRKAEGFARAGYRAFNQERYKISLLSCSKCLSLLKSISFSGNNSMFLSKEYLKREIDIIRPLIVKSQNNSLQTMFKKAVEAYNKGHLRLCASLLTSIRERLNAGINPEVLDAKEKSIRLRIRQLRAGDRNFVKINKMFAEYTHLKNDKKYEQAMIILEKIEYLLKGQ